MRAIRKALMDMHAATMHGRKYGYVGQKFDLNVAGQRSAGVERIPPTIGLPLSK